MRTIQCEGGHSRDFKLDKRAIMQLTYLRLYFEAAHGLRVSTAVLVRLAIAVLVNEVNTAPTWKSSPEVCRRLTEAAQCHTPTLRALPAAEPGEPYPTWRELEAAAIAKERQKPLAQRAPMPYAWAKVDPLVLYEPAFSHHPLPPNYEELINAKR